MGNNSQFPVMGISPLGGNGAEATGACNAPVRETGALSVPLVWDDRVQAFISEQAVENLDDRDDSLAKAEIFNQEQEFKSNVGFKTSLPS